MTQEFDLIVIGGGSGGIACARRAAAHGARVAIIERNRLGGTCVNVGCVPKKIMWHASEFAHVFEDAPGYGFEVTRGDFDWAALKHKRDAYLKRLNGIYARNLDNDNVERIEGDACFESAQTVRVGDRTMSASHILVATGGYPQLPAFPGAEHCITSDGFFELESLPMTVSVIGAGYIAVELAGMLGSLGAQVDLLIRRDALLRDFDAFIGEAILSELSASGVRVHPKSPVDRIEREGNALWIHAGDAVHRCDVAIAAIGRSPATEGLNLDRAGLSTDERGFINTDAFQNTSVDGIYAVGDVTGRAALTPVAIAAGRRLADRLFDGQSDRHLDYANIPTVVFSHPPIGSIGLSEEEAARECSGPVRVYEAQFNALYYAMLEKKHSTTMKLITSGPEERVVGCHVVGKGADEMMQGFAVAIRMGATKAEFDETVAIHPTSAEELVTMRSPAREYPGAGSE